MGIKIEFEDAGKEVFYILTRGGRRTTFRGKISRLSYERQKFAGRFGLSTRKSENLEYDIVNQYFEWRKQKS